MSAKRFIVRPNVCGGSGYHIIDLTTNKTVAWVYDQEHGYIDKKQDEERARQAASVWNKNEEGK